MNMFGDINFIDTIIFFSNIIYVLLFLGNYEPSLVVGVCPRSGVEICGVSKLNFQ